MDNAHAFSAIRGIQGGREYYVAMVPLKVVPKIFLFDDADLPADLRAQRTVNRARIPDIARYLVENPRNYTFSSLTASIDGNILFEPFGTRGVAETLGRLLIPMTARFLINDGQHRRAAIEEALKECPQLGEETISVIFFADAGLKRSQQNVCGFEPPRRSSPAIFGSAIRPSGPIGTNGVPTGYAGECLQEPH